MYLQEISRCRSCGYDEVGRSGLKCPDCGGDMLPRGMTALLNGQIAVSNNGTIVVKEKR